MSGITQQCDSNSYTYDTNRKFLHQPQNNIKTREKGRERNSNGKRLTSGTRRETERETQKTKQQ
jgi:hypothetical protein